MLIYEFRGVSPGDLIFLFSREMRRKEADVPCGCSAVFLWISKEEMMKEVRLTG